MKRLLQRLPFLKFLAPVMGGDLVEPVGLRGDLLVESSIGGRRTVVYNGHNFIVDLGKTSVRDLLLGSSGGGFSGSIFRMAVGDGGTPPDELFNPKTPDSSWPARTGLFHEVIRQDVSSFSAPSASSARFVGSFQSTDVDLTSFSLAERVINEAALIIGDGVLTVGDDKKQINKVPPDTVDIDEKMMSMRTFRSSPFDPALSVSISITWTITVVTS